MVAQADADRMAGRWAEAERRLREVLREQPEHAGAHAAVGQVRLAQGRPRAAERSLRQALHHSPDHAGALLGLGRLLLAEGRHPEASGVLTALVRAHPEDASGRVALGTALRAQGRFGEALGVLETAARQRPDWADAHTEQGNVLFDLGRWAEASAAFAAAVRAAPESERAHLGLGVVATLQGRFDTALGHLTTAARLDPGLVEAHSSLGDTLRCLGQLDAAEASLRTALRLRPGHADAQVNLAFVLLQAGRYAEGWRMHESRWGAAAWRSRPRPPRGPRWAGEPVQGRTVLVHAEQGLGDTLQFCRFVAQLPLRTRIVLQVQPPLVSLLRGLRGLPADAEVIGQHDALPGFDMQCALMSLPHVLGTTLETIPADIPYLAADPLLSRHAADWLRGLPGLKVGLVWAGDPAMAADARRSMALRQFAPLATLDGISFISLQREPAGGPAPPGFVVHDAAAHLADFRRTAALVDGLDLVIGVDTAVIHLAGALGRPVWLLNRFDTCWRWGATGNGSPWYPTLRQFRQPSPGDWEPVMDAVRGALKVLLQAGRPG